MSKPLLEKELFAKLPHWATVAFLARCGRRLLPLYENDTAEPREQRAAVVQAIRLAEKRAALGGAVDSHEFLEFESEFIDNYDVDSLAATLHGCVEAASNTHTDLGMPESEIILAVSAIAQSSFIAAFADALTLDVNLPTLAEEATAWAVFSDATVKTQVLRDYSTLSRLAADEAWHDQTPAPKEIFGDLWPEGRPAAWPPIRLSFRPRARIIRTIGDRLISGPEAAVIELIKNSHDADASFARVTFVPPLKKDLGFIIVEDDGHGMTLSDIEQKWMEPATGDKRDRKLSPGGRRLLGSKGIGRFAASRLGRYLELISTAPIRNAQANDSPDNSGGFPPLQTTRIPQIDWNAFEEFKYLEDVQFTAELLSPAATTGTSIRISSLRDDWPVTRLEQLYQELRRLISPLGQRAGGKPFRIFLDLSECTEETCGFDGSAIVNTSSGSPASGIAGERLPHEVQPFPILDACDYSVEGIFDETGTFSGRMTILRAGLEPEEVQLSTPLRSDEGEEPCGLVLARLHIFDREADAVRQTAAKAGFGTIGLREARKLLDSISGVAIYRESFRIRPYGDGENDWLTLDAKRVQNPTMKIGRNQIAGTIVVEDENTSHLIERSSREGLEENGAFRRLQSLVSNLLSEVVEPRRRRFRINAGLEERGETSFKEVFRRVQLGWAKLLVAKIPEPDRAEAEALVAKETDRLSAYLKRLEERQAQLEAKVTLGLIIGEVMHQGNTPLSFLETETARLIRWWPHLTEHSAEAKEDRAEVPRLLNGMGSSSQKLRVLFNALEPLSGARRGQPKPYDAATIIAQSQYLFRSRIENLHVAFTILPDESGRKVLGFPDDLATAVTNLFDNALYWLEHHNISNPAITVSIRTDAEHCLINVADNGIGIPAEFADQVFDVGFTLKPNGTGLGLSIAKEAAMRSNGDLQLLSSAVGAAFRITLPCEGPGPSDTSIENKEEG